ncbi:hypothetical protein tpqmel_0033 [Candidatus Gastranaerophilus sp. (ex Termes propinquus)]|nr:hypothetical protein tpqmel_0033 [Candidatus Gastranaerophilus sp. (ex Termes propinquus)]
MKDNLNSINCPACGKVMEKIYMSEQKFNIDICSKGCGGLFLDNREFNKIDEPHENIDEITEALKGKVFQEVDSAALRVCPVCRTNMVKNHVSARKEIEIDECYGCGGKFLDHGELEQMRGQYATATERDADVVKYVYGLKNVELAKVEADAKKARENRSPLQNLFGALLGF